MLWKIGIETYNTNVSQAMGRKRFEKIKRFSLSQQLMALTKFLFHLTNKKFKAYSSLKKNVY